MSGPSKKSSPSSDTPENLLVYVERLRQQAEEFRSTVEEELRTARVLLEELLAQADAAAYRGLGRTADAATLIKHWWRDKSFEAEPQLIPEVEGFLATLFGEIPPAADALARAREVAPLAGELIEPLLGMTVAPTMAHASDKRNVIPGLCEITVDTRLLPGQTPDEAEATIRAWLGEGDYDLVNTEGFGGTRSAISGPLWDAVQSFVDVEEPGAAAAPICVAGFTDSHWMRGAFGTVAYGFFPSRELDSETAARLIHSANERVPVSDLELGVRWLRHAAQTVCG